VPERVGETVCEPGLVRLSSSDLEGDGDDDGDVEGDRGRDAADPPSSWALPVGTASGGATGWLAGGAPPSSTPTGLLFERGCVDRSGAGVRRERVGIGAAGRGW
jgi:hypothetical protein